MMHGLTGTVILWLPNSALPEDFNLIDHQSAPDHQVHLWRDGFSIGKGGLLSHGYSKHKQWLTLIHSGVAPSELFATKPGEPIDVEVIPHEDEDYKEAAARVSGYLSAPEKQLAKVFGIVDPDARLVVELQRVVAPQIDTHAGMVVKYTGHIAAADSVDKLRVEQKRLAFEFIADTNGNGPLEFKGPPLPAPAPPASASRPAIPNKPASLIGISPSTARAMVELVCGKDYTLFWEKAMLIDKKRKVARGRREDYLAQQHQRGNLKWVYNHKDWVCPFCDQYHYGKNVHCPTEGCGVWILAELEDAIAAEKEKVAVEALSALDIKESVNKAGGKAERKTETRYVEGNRVIFFARPSPERVAAAAATPFLSLMAMFPKDAAGNPAT
ncbi:hypothetical protein BDV95DRAFT_216734 [Massariosphaeria phaeospora]|uniref:SEP domain-containing protein n=1 Tax=Massariosphaeria phaeospora TaxID=100035 RepID=A0A7C8MGM8_9PLEO|nr:hypothetical protein BDV95DRAFT_216734 [Massariosphaeria phaeospora]